jgi:hypothetical protein
LFGKNKHQAAPKTVSIVVPDDPLRESPRLIRAEARIASDNLVFRVRAGLFQGFDCWVPLCRCKSGCAIFDEIQPQGGDVPYCREMLVYPG